MQETYEKISLFPSALFREVFIEELSQALGSRTEKRDRVAISQDAQSVGWESVGKNRSMSQLYMSGLKKTVYQKQTILMDSFDYINNKRF